MYAMGFIVVFVTHVNANSSGESFENRVSRLMAKMAELQQDPNMDPETYQAQLHEAMKGAVAKAVFYLPALENQTSYAISGKRLGLYGDSLTAGYPSYEAYAKSLQSSLAEVGISVDIVGCSFIGHTAFKMVQDLDQGALSVQDSQGRAGPGLRSFLEEQGPFDLVIILAGTNDCLESKITAETGADSLKILHQACWKAGVDTVALSIPECCLTGTVSYPNEKRKWHLINHALATWTSSFVNSSSLISFDNAACRHGLWEKDGLHFSANGSREFGKRLAPIIAKRLQPSYITARKETRPSEELDTSVMAKDCLTQPRSSTRPSATRTKPISLGPTAGRPIIGKLRLGVLPLTGGARNGPSSILPRSLLQLPRTEDIEGKLDVHTVSAFIFISAAALSGCIVGHFVTSVLPFLSKDTSSEIETPYTEVNP